MTKLQWKYLIFVICSLIIGGSVLAAGYFYSQFKKEELNVKQDLQVKLHDCYGEVETNYTVNWKAMCKSLDREESCNLPQEYEALVTNERDSARNGCDSVFAWN